MRVRLACLPACVKTCLPARIKRVGRLPEKKVKVRKPRLWPTCSMPRCRKRHFAWGMCAACVSVSEAVRSRRGWVPVGSWGNGRPFPSFSPSGLVGILWREILWRRVHVLRILLVTLGPLDCHVWLDSWPDVWGWRALWLFVLLMDGFDSMRS